MLVLGNISIFWEIINIAIFYLIIDCFGEIFNIEIWYFNINHIYCLNVCYTHGVYCLDMRSNETKISDSHLF